MTRRTTDKKRSSRARMLRITRRAQRLLKRQVTVEQTVHVHFPAGISTRELTNAVRRELLKDSQRNGPRA